MADYHIPLFPEHTYHIISHAVGNEKLFKTEENYSFLLRRFQKHVLPVADTFAWCLLPNHFHFMVRIKPMETIKEHFERMKTNKKFHADESSDFLMKRFSNWLNSYTKAFNKMFNRKGALFIDYLRRVEIENNTQFGATIFYIHKNPVHHLYSDKIDKWKWSSFNSFTSNEKTWLMKEEVLKWFDGGEGFCQYHQQPINLKDTVILE